MALSDIFCFAYGSFQGTCLDDLSNDDFMPEILVKELGFLERLTGAGFQNFEKYFTTNQASKEEWDAGIVCLSAFCERIQKISADLGTLAEKVKNDKKVDGSKLVCDLRTVATSKGIVLKNPKIEDLFDTDAEAPWAAPFENGRVNFRNAVSFIRLEEDGEGSSTQHISHPEVKSEFSRKKGRKATGYAKFNLPDFGLDDDEHGGENKNVAEDILKPAKNSSASISASLGNEERGVCRSAASFFLCGLCEKDFTVESGGEDICRSSSVLLGNTEEIHDGRSDVRWGEEDRHEDRFQRIRARVPTGHVSKVTANSEELRVLLAEYDAEEAKDAMDVLIQNTQLNACTPPESVYYEQIDVDDADLTCVVSFTDKDYGGLKPDDRRISNVALQKIECGMRHY